MPQQRSELDFLIVRRVIKSDGQSAMIEGLGKNIMLKICDRSKTKRTSKK